MFPITVTVHSPAQLDAVMRALGVGLAREVDPRQMELPLAPGLAVIEPKAEASKAALTDMIDQTFSLPTLAQVEAEVRAIGKAVGLDKVRAAIKTYAPELAKVAPGDYPALLGDVRSLQAAAPKPETVAADPKVEASALLSKVAARDKKAALAVLQEHGVDRLDKAPTEKLPAIMRDLRDKLETVSA